MDEFPLFVKALDSDRTSCADVRLNVITNILDIECKHPNS